MPYYRQHEDYVLPETEKAAEQVFSLPVHPGLKATEVNYVARAVRQIMR
jgi:dTDP-4-amino-4,6-dideoxygalactose transaminase